MKILITAGGTTEKIDEVRQISNNSTGALGHQIAESFLRCGKDIEKIFYVCGKTAVEPPQSEAIDVRRIAGVAELKDVLEQIFSLNTVDGVVHCMAVSDYAVKNVTTLELIEKAAEEELHRHVHTGAGPCEELPGIIRRSLERPGSLAQTGKISSDVENLLVVMTKTPKIIGMIKKLQPQTVLTGFKLLSRVSVPELIKTGHELLKRNSCDFVFANDLAELSKDSHAGYLIFPDGSHEKLCGRKQIADRIVSVVTAQILGGGG